MYFRKIHNTLRVFHERRGTMVLADITAKRIVDIRKENGLKQSDIAEIMGFSPSAVGMYERGVREIPCNKLVKFANYFNVSTDYLLGNSDFKYTVDYFFSSDQFDEENIRQLLSLMNNNQLELSTLIKSFNVKFKGVPLSDDDIEKLLILAEGLYFNK